MREAHLGVPPAGLPLTDWRSPEPSPAAPAAPALDSPVAGPPMNINRSGEELQSAVADTPLAPPPTYRAGPAPDDHPVPPGMIPHPAANALTARDKGLIERLLGAM